jgi:hypothetical protein
MLAVLRQGSDQDSCERVVALLNKGVAPQSVWDALFAGAGELLMRQPGIVPLHAVTSTNALHFGFQNSGNEETRRLLLLQNAAFVPLFRARMEANALPKLQIDQLEALAPKSSGADAIGEIFADVGKDRMTAARKTLAYLKDNPQPKELMDAARLLIFLKGNAHALFGRRSVPIARQRRERQSDCRTDAGGVEGVVTSAESAARAGRVPCLRCGLGCCLAAD